MAIELNIASDFATIVDGVEAITLKRRASAATIAVPKAWRYSSVTQSAEPGVSGVAQSDVVWQFGWEASVDKPRVGDSLIDAANECWTILSVEIRGNNSRLRCATRNLRIQHELDNRLEIQQAIWEDSGSGPEIVGWTTLWSAVPARIQPERTTIDHATDPPTSIAIYHVHLAHDTPLDHNHRIVDQDGSIYQVKEYARSERIDTLPVAIVHKQAMP